MILHGLYSSKAYALYTYLCWLVLEPIQRSIAVVKIYKLANIMISEGENMESVMEFEAPCCNSVRTCNPTENAIHVISLVKFKVLRTIEPVRCYRLGYVPKFKFYPAPHIALVRVYLSNRRNVYIDVLWKPQEVDEQTVKDITLLALGLIEIPEIKISE